MRGRRPQGGRDLMRGVHNVPTYRLDTRPIADAIREAVLQGVASPEVARVIQPDDGPHYEFHVEGGVVADITLEVELVSTGEQLTARYATCTSGGLSGVFNIPDPGTEVLVLLDGGDLIGAMVVAQLGGGGFPLAAQQAVGGKIVIVGETEVVITDPAGGGEAPVATLADVQTIRDELHNHAHTYIPGGNPATETTGNPSVTSPTGTQILKTK